MSYRIGFVGLGVMGFPMAGHLAAAGHEIAVFNRTVAVAQRWSAQHGGRVARTPREAAHGAQFVFACVGADPDVRDVLAGADGAIAGAPPDAVIVDHTTASAEVAREMAALAADAGLGFVDAPVSGGQAGAESGRLTVMAGGDAVTFARVEPVLSAYAARVVRIGPVGSGQLAKMVNQVCIAGVLQGLAEGLVFAKAAGLDTSAVIDAIKGGAAQSWQMDNRANTMVEGRFDFGFAVDWMRKDLALALAEARRIGVGLPLTALVDQFYAAVQQLGGGRQDTSSLIRALVDDGRPG